ncbi:putative house-cleaning noncanonical NTP pyrophosphatase (MazG superfamily) [Saccharothrix carnea]|uniref:Putative house-cleaning noncanonical NTP pyrophosphatase (MazG superfamily) n=1 Tax=Saccharothrix carnea TaxID=1280637 RepID=A0A2P8IAP0_SACCR|nr:nucleoside triphosphate pyrophosphohydrolase [Saccharothrix carnea]PSL55531.1 putative house-cleaning noncanonical NTP pyrophosphatase (MazG superfamily) [Saccharothrix carnea]
MDPDGKLVRDLVPDLIRAEGGDPVVRRATPGEYRERLIAKLVEEAVEAAGAVGDDLVEELADVLEVVHAISAHHGVPFDRIEAARVRKAVERGGFAGGVVWLGNR